MRQVIKTNLPGHETAASTVVYSAVPHSAAYRAVVVRGNLPPTGVLYEYMTWSCRRKNKESERMNVIS